MSKIKKVAPKKKLSPEPAETTPAVLGRKRDQALDTNIVQATTEILAEVGFDVMTMDMVAARAKAGKASLYRRWKSKAELVRDSMIWMSKNSVEVNQVPDTGSLRDDLYALQKSYSAEYSDHKLKVLAGLGSFFAQHRELAEEATSGIFAPFVHLQKVLIKRAIERKEIPAQVDIELATELIVGMISYRTRILGEPFDKAYYGYLLDHAIMPMLKNPPSRGKK